jgi:hypothetical protein
MSTNAEETFFSYFFLLSLSVPFSKVQVLMTTFKTMNFRRDWQTGQLFKNKEKLKFGGKKTEKNALVFEDRYDNQKTTFVHNYKNNGRVKITVNFLK